MELFNRFAGRSRWLVLAVAVAAQFMVILDVAVVNVALPAIKADLGFSQESLQWVITAYAILFGGALLLGGRLADLLGRRRMFSAGVALFTAGSLLSGLAWSAGSLVVFRALQGLGGALLSPAALSIVVTTFAEGRERNTALGIWGAVSGSGAAVGVLLGGVLTSYLGWAWIFFVNIPVGAAVLAITPLLLRENRPAGGPRHFDLAGAASITGGLMLAVYALTRAATDGWTDGAVLGTLAGALALIVAFAAIERRSPAPLLPLRIFRSRSLSAANAVMVAIGVATFAEFFLTTLYLQQVLRYSAIQTGLAFIAITVTIAVTSNAGQALTTRLGPRRVLTAGMLLSAVSTLLYARMPADAQYFSDIMPAFVLGGVGLGLSFVPVTIAAMADVAPADAGVASGLINTTRQVGGAIGLSVVTTIATTATAHYLQGHPGAGHAVALTHGFDVAFYVLAGVSLLGTVVAATLLRGPAAGPAPAAAAEPVAEAATSASPHPARGRAGGAFPHRAGTRPAHRPARGRPQPAATVTTHNPGTVSRARRAAPTHR